MVGPANSKTWGLTPAVDCNWNTTAGALPDGSYTITVQIFDVAGNSAYGTPRTVTVDNNAPTPFTHVNFTEASPNLYWNGTPGTPIWYDPDVGANFTVRMSAADAGVGMQHVSFPSLGAGWTPAGANVPGAGPNFDFSYTYTPSPATPGSVTPIAVDNAGNPRNGTFIVNPDNTAPTGATIDVAGAIQQSTSTTITYSTGTDLESGINTWYLERNTSPLAGNNCTSWAGWTPIAASTGVPVSYTDNTLAGPGNCYEYRLVVTDRVGNSTTATDAAAFTVKVDNRAPAGSISAAPVGPISGNNVGFTGNATDDETGVQKIKVDYSGPSAGNMCDNVVPVAGVWNCSWDTLARAPGLYTLTLRVTDLAGNWYETQRTVMVDNTGPTIVSLAFNDGGSTFAHAIGSTAYFNPAGAGTIRVDVDANDGAGSGMKEIVYPGLVFAPWGPGGTDSVAPYEWPYAWASHPAGTANPGAKTVNAVDNANNVTTAPFSIVEDALPPAGVTLDVTPQVRNTAGTIITFLNGSDGQSGLRERRLQRERTAYANGVCVGPWTGMANLGLVNPVSSYNDTTIQNGFCYRYQIVVTDNVNNVTTVADPDVVSMDDTRPVGFINNTPVGPVSGDNVSITGAADDGGSRVAKVDVRYKNGPAATPSGVICLNPTPLAPPAPASSTTWGSPAHTDCLWDTLTLGLVDGMYTLEIIVTDVAGNASIPYTRLIQVDNQPPLVTFNSFSEGTNLDYQHWAGGPSTTMYYNPAFGGSFDVRIDVNDGGGTGAQRVDFVDPGAAAPAIHVKVSA